MMLFQILLENGTSAATPPVGGSGNWMAWIVLILLVMVILIFLITRLKKLFSRPELHGMDRARIASNWAQIEQATDQGVMGAKIAVMEADKLLDGVLKSMYFPGETMADRMRVAAYKYPAIRNVWPAHKLRNQLVHDMAFEITPRQAKNAVRDYATALKALNVM